MEYHPWLEYRVVTQSDLAAVLPPVGWEAGAHGISAVSAPVHRARPRHPPSPRAGHLVERRPRSHGRLHLTESDETAVGQPLRILGGPPDRCAPHTRRRITRMATTELEEEHVALLETMALVCRVGNTRVA